MFCWDLFVGLDRELGVRQKRKSDAQRLVDLWLTQEVHWLCALGMVIVQSARTEVSVSSNDSC